MLSSLSEKQWKRREVKWPRIWFKVGGLVYMFARERTACSVAGENAHKTPFHWTRELHPFHKRQLPRKEMKGCALSVFFVARPRPIYMDLTLRLSSQIGPVREPLGLGSWPEGAHSGRGRAVFGGFIESDVAPGARTPSQSKQKVDDSLQEKDREIWRIRAFWRCSFLATASFSGHAGGWPEFAHQKARQSVI